MTMLASIMGVWIIASIISSSPGVQTGADDKNLGRLAKFSSEEATFNDNACKNPKYSLHPKDHDADEHVKINCPAEPGMVFPNLYAIDEQHIRAKLDGVNYELFRFEKK
jgi:hypothetical protein